LVENYAVWESTKPGVYRSVSCAAEYFNNNVANFSPTRTIATYEGSEALNSKWENPNAASSFTAAEYEPIFTEIDDEYSGYRQTWEKKKLA